MDKYGPEAFEKEILATTSSQDGVRALESHYIVAFDSYENGYNCNYGGAGWLEIPEPIRRKIGDAQRGKVIPLDARNRMSRAKRGDSRCAMHLGPFASKGSASPLARRYLIGHPDGAEEVVVGLREFCRSHGLQYAKLASCGRTKGFVLLRRFNDYPEREYGQAAGKGGNPERG